MNKLNAYYKTKRRKQFWAIVFLMMLPVTIMAVIIGLMLNEVLLFTAFIMPFSLFISMVIALITKNWLFRLFR